jgi:hypothetical protein
LVLDPQKRQMPCDLVVPGSVMDIQSLAMGKRCVTRQIFSWDWRQSLSWERRVFGHVVLWVADG